MISFAGELVRRLNKMVISPEDPLEWMDKYLTFNIHYGTSNEKDVRKVRKALIALFVDF
jgi:hypothetical protein